MKIKSIIVDDEKHGRENLSQQKAEQFRPFERDALHILATAESFGKRRTCLDFC